MGIIFDEQQRLFHLQGKEISYLFCILKNEQLGHLYFGKKIHPHSHFAASLRIVPRALTTCVYEGDLAFSLDSMPQEYPAYGKTDFRHPAYQVENEDGNTISELVYVSHLIRKGKPALPGLPATYVERDDEAETLEVTLRDPYLDLFVTLTYTVYEQFNAITRSARFENRGTQRLHLLRALSMSLDFHDAEFDLLHLSGAWARERHIQTRRLMPGVQSIDSTRGASSAFFNPFIALKRPQADEFQGDVYGFNFVYSGNFLAEVEVNPYDVTRVSMGINPFDFKWLLAPGETFQTPEVVMVYSDAGLNGMSQTFHALYRTRLARGEWRDKPRPVLINNWEATYFNFNEEKILSLGRAAQKLGIELLVLDDGWFGHRDDDTTSLGDWVVDRKKLPNGLKYLGEEINKLGLRFGLWLEPEMINKESDLYRAHPDWLIHVPNRRLSHGRNQFILDYSRQEVRDVVYEMLVNILTNAPISYIKWDMNRNMTEIGSAGLPKERQKETAHRYILGLYELLERLTQRFPQILFESCASGGGRFDPGMLYYMPQTWASDNSDAIERLKIQYGTSLAYPLSAIGAHVSAVPNHQVGRIEPIDTRANVAFFGAFGYELDIERLSQADLDAISKQVAFYKAHRALVQQGTFYRLTSPFERNYTCWMVVSPDQREALLGYYKVLAQPNPKFLSVKLQGLAPEMQYDVQDICNPLKANPIYIEYMQKQGLTEPTLRIYGDELLHRGFALPIEVMNEGDFSSYLWKLTAV